MFKSREGYVFHDSRGFEAGGEDELKIVQAFVRRKSREERLKGRLHAIWFVLLGILSRGLGSTRFVFQVLHSDGQ
jgi:hypothetical protein